MNELEELMLCAASDHTPTQDYLHDLVKRVAKVLGAAHCGIANAGARTTDEQGYAWLTINDPDTFFAQMRATRAGVLVDDFVFNIPELGEVTVSWRLLRAWLASHMALTADTDRERRNWACYMSGAFIK